MMDEFGLDCMPRMTPSFSLVSFGSGHLIHSHREIVHSPPMQQQQPQVIVVNNGVPQPQNPNPGQAQSTRGASTTGPMTVNTCKIKSLEKEKRRMKQELEKKKKQRREIEDLRHQIDDQDRSSSSRPSASTTYTSRALPPTASTFHSSSTRPQPSAPTRIDRRPTDLYWALGPDRASNPTLPQIHSAYQKSCMDHHPDRVKHSSDRDK